MGGQSDVEKWSISDVAQWLRKISLPDEAVALFTEHAIDGRALISLTDEDMKTEMGLKLGHRKSLLHELGLLLKAPAVLAATAADTVVSAKATPAPVAACAVPAGVPKVSRALFRSSGSSARLLKGFLPIGKPISPADLQKHRISVYNADRKAYVPRDVPLTDEELECWSYQASWIVCPISGRSWRDPDSLMGTALYHSPRFLSEREKQRLILEETAAQAEKKQAREHGIKEDDGDEWEKDFDAYPIVDAPPASYIENIGELPRDVQLGIIEVITGPAFDIRAYNWGVTGNEAKKIIRQSERGIVQMDQQYNAVNFLYYLLRAENSYERKRCTNRLSFFIEEEHGARIFPSNIESQLSLLVYRDKRIMSEAGTDHVLLADCIRKAIPRILKAVVLEVVHGRDTALSFRIDHAIRTYLLIHQVSIKLICYYKRAYEAFYRSIIRWIQNPFSEENCRTWPDLEEVMIAASLCGISWSVIREAFVRKMLAEFLVNVPRSCSREDRLVVMFANNRELIVRLVTEFSFFVSGSSLSELDRRYARCAGSLPAREREAMKTQVLEAREIDTFPKFWVALGMDVGCPDDIILRHIDQYIRYVIGSVAEWRRSTTESEGNIAVPPLDAASWVADSALARREQQKKHRELAVHRSAEHQRMLKIHEGYPRVVAPGILGASTCNYPGCGKVFANRHALFQHLKKFIPKERMIKGYHQSHFAISRPDIAGGKCQSAQCSFKGNEEQMHLHYVQMGVPSIAGEYKPTSAAASIASSPSVIAAAIDTAIAVAQSEHDTLADPFDNPHTCVVCADAKRNVVFAPCGHLVCCHPCAKKLHSGCPICRSPVRDCIVVFYS